MKYLLSSVMILLFMESYCQRVTGGEPEKNRADAFFDKVWKKYRLDGHPGLFSEHYPRGEKTELDYFQGANVREKDASFLWPLSGMCSAANVLIKFPDLKEKYSGYLDTLAIGLWTYRDSIRKPIGYRPILRNLKKLTGIMMTMRWFALTIVKAFRILKMPSIQKKPLKYLILLLVAGMGNSVGVFTGLKGTRIKNRHAVMGWRRLPRLSFTKLLAIKFIWNGGSVFTIGCIHPFAILRASTTMTSKWMASLIQHTILTIPGRCWRHQ